MTSAKLPYNWSMAKRQPRIHTADDFGLDVLSGDLELFRWFLLCYLFGKPIRSESAVKTWQLFVDRKIDTPWAIKEARAGRLSSLLREGGYARYDGVTSRGLQTCVDQLIREYDGSLLMMIESSETEDEFSKRLQKLHGVGPKVAEIFMRETEEYFARRVE